jgi:serine/threonine protein kinase
MFRSSTENDIEIKLIDFGISAKVKDHLEKLHSVVGSPYSIAPEVFEKQYDR